MRAEDSEVGFILVNRSHVFQQDCITATLEIAVVTALTLWPSLAQYYDTAITVEVCTHFGLQYFAHARTFARSNLLLLLAVRKELQAEIEIREAKNWLTVRV